MTDDLADFYAGAADDMEEVLVQGVQATALFDVASEVVLGDALVVAPTLRLPSTVAAAEDGQCVVRGMRYVIRAVKLLPPDGREHQLVLAQVRG